MTDKSKPGPKPTVTDEEFISLFEEADDPVLSTAEVTEKVSLSRRSVYDRLASLQKDGTLASKKVGGRSTVWWIPPD